MFLLKNLGLSSVITLYTKEGRASNWMQSWYNYVDAPRPPQYRTVSPEVQGGGRGGWEHISQSGSSVVMYMYVLPKEQDLLWKRHSQLQRSFEDDWFFVVKRPLSANAIYLLWSE